MEIIAHNPFSHKPACSLR